jgi:hypothetical protein
MGKPRALLPLTLPVIPAQAGISAGKDGLQMSRTTAELPASAGMTEIGSVLHG